MPLRRFYLIADPMQTVYAESMAALHGGDSAVRKCLPAWAARAMSQGKLVEPCVCCNKLTDMVTDQDPTVAIPRERFYSLYRETTLTKH